MKIMFLFSGLVSLFFLSTLFASDDPQHIPDSNQFSFTYHVTVKDLPKDSSKFNLWIPVAKDTFQQDIKDRKISSPVPYKVLKDARYGNEFLFLDFKEIPKRPIDIQIAYQVETKGKRSRFDRASIKNQVEDDFDIYLGASRLVVMNDEIKELARKATSRATTDLAKARGIYDYVIKHMAYDKSGTGWGQGDTMYACNVGKGNCTDFHSLFISLSRVSGIPARFKIGAQIPWDQTEGDIGYHCWAEFYLPQYGWIPVDASEAWKNSKLKEYYFGSTDPGKFTISMGRDIPLKPKQVGKPINIFIYPYAEVDGEPFNEIETNFTFKKVVLKGASI